MPLGPGVTYITPLWPVASIEFMNGGGVDRWEVTLTGGEYPGEKPYSQLLTLHGKLLVRRREHGGGT